VPSTNGMRDLSAFLEKYPKELQLPAIAAAVVRGTNIIAGNQCTAGETNSLG
jgi:hypothetical protein